jgi:monoamine oxidase
MENKEPLHYKVIIIGAGLTGLATAFYLEQKGYSPLIVEGRNRTGGRIETVPFGRGRLDTGAAWFADKHTHLMKLISELNVTYYRQYLGKQVYYDLYQGIHQEPLSRPQEPTYKLTGGSAHIIQALEQHLTTSTIRLDEPVQLLDFTREQLIRVESSKGVYTAEKVISTLPPALLIKTIKCIPSLPDDLTNIAAATHTWMGESIKAAVTTSEGFWRTAETGTLFSQQGPLMELHDHSLPEENAWILKGFIHPDFARLKREERSSLAIEQVERIFPGASRQPVKYLEKDWSTDAYTTLPYPVPVSAHQHNGHSIYRNTWYKGRLMVAGSETASAFAGYMNGAVCSAREVADLF